MLGGPETIGSAVAGEDVAGPSTVRFMDEQAANTRMKTERVARRMGDLVENCRRVLGEDKPVCDIGYYLTRDAGMFRPFWCRISSVTFFSALAMKVN